MLARRAISSEVMVVQCGTEPLLGLEGIANTVSRRTSFFDRPLVCSQTGGAVNWIDDEVNEIEGRGYTGRSIPSNDRRCRQSQATDGCLCRYIFQAETTLRFGRGRHP